MKSEPRYSVSLNGKILPLYKPAEARTRWFDETDPFIYTEYRFSIIIGSVTGLTEFKQNYLFEENSLMIKFNDDNTVLVECNVLISEYFIRQKQIHEKTYFLIDFIALSKRHNEHRREWLEKRHHMTEINKDYPHKCFKCGHELRFEELYNANFDSSLVYLEKLWKSEFVKFYCCGCYRKINEWQFKKVYD